MTPSATVTHNSHSTVTTALALATMGSTTNNRNDPICVSMPKVAKASMTVIVTQGDQKIRKNSQIFQRIAPKVAKSKKAKISTTKLNLKAQTKLYIKPL